MVIAIDYDDTYTADPDFWRKFIHAANNSGHTIIMVTQRCRCYPEQVREVEERVGRLLPIIFAGDPLLAQSKMQAAQTAGYVVDVWIDDNPQSVLVPMYRRQEV